MTKFGIVFILILIVSAAGATTRTRASLPSHSPPGVIANERLTSVAGALLFVLVVAIAATTLYLPAWLPAHYVVGLLMVPLVVLKVGTTGYRFTRYYLGDRIFRLAGPPAPALRLFVAPVLVVSTAVVFSTGVELWLFGLRFGTLWQSAHTVSAVAFMLATGAHLIAHLRRSAEAAGAEFAASAPAAATTRRAVLLGTLLFGAILAGASVLYATPYPPGAAT